MATIFHCLPTFENVTMEVSLAFPGVPLYANVFAVLENIKTVDPYVRT
jgi:hypothetical protein